MVKGLIVALATLTVSASAAVAATSPWEPALSADSSFIRDLYAKPASDFHAVLMAREAATFADDRAAAERLGAYLEGFALATLGGLNPQPAASIGDIVSGKAPAFESKELRAKLLATTLRPKVVHAADGHALFPAKEPAMFLDYRYEGHSVWSSRNSNDGTPSWVYLRIVVENAGPHPVTQFDFRLHVRLPDGNTVELACRAKPWMERALPPGAGAQHVCSTRAGDADAARLVAAVRAFEKDPAAWRLQPSRINFVEPQVSLNSNGVFWPYGATAKDEVLAGLRAASCFERNSCLEDLKRKLQYDPVWPMAAIGIVPAVLLGAGFSFFPGVQWRAARIASGLSVVCYVGTLVVLASTGQGVFAAMMMSIFGLTALGAFNATLWTILGLLNALRRPKAAA